LISDIYRGYLFRKKLEFNRNSYYIGKIILLISFLVIITSSASIVTKMAQVYGKNAEYASIINVATTIVCIVIMPIMVWLYQI